MNIKKLLMMCFTLCASAQLFAHGLMENPASRNWICGATTKPDQVDNGTAEHPECGTAFATNPIAGYSFMSVLTHAQGRSVVTPLPTHVCSFGSETWKGAQTPWDVPMDWPAQPMGTGEQTITWNISWGPHFDDTAEFRYWITKADFQFSPTRELTWDDFESTPFCVLSYDDKNPTANPAVISDKDTSHFYTKCNIPERSGHHVIYGEWGRLPPTYERFHGCIDAAFTGTPPEPVVASMSYTPAATNVTGAASIQFNASASQGTNLTYNWTLESVNQGLYNFSSATSATPTLTLTDPQAETLFTVRLTVSNGTSSNTTTQTFHHYPSVASNWMDFGALTSSARTLAVGDTVRVRMVDSNGLDTYFPASALTISSSTTAATAWPYALAQLINAGNSDIQIGTLNNGVITATQNATSNRVYAVAPSNYVAAYLTINSDTGSSSSSSSSSSSIASSTSSAVSEQCNWYGTLYPLCVTTQSGWGWENNKNCITRVTCAAQPAPYGVVGGSGSSSQQSSSVASSVSSSKISSSASSSSVVSSSNSSSSLNSSAAAGVLFSDNFESGAVNTQPSGWDNLLAWNYNAANSVSNDTYALIDNSKAYSGSKSIHFKGSLSEIVRALPAGIQRLHMRAYVNLSKQLGNDAGDNHEHIMGIKKTPDANNEVRVGQIKGVLGTNEVPSDNIAPTMDKWYSGTQLNPDTWYCVETAMYADTAYDQLYFWVNGNLVHSITSGADWNNGALGADWLSDKFNYVMFGFQSFSNNTADVWMDDIVVSTEPIGCGNSSSSASSLSSSSSSSLSSSSISSSSSSSTGVSSSSSTSAASSSSATTGNCAYVVTNEWNNGFTAAIRITNNGASAINGWNVNWSYSDGTLVTSSWNANLSGTNPYSATGLSWNSVIQPGQTVEFGLQGNKGSSSSAQTPSVSGSVCQ